MITIRIDVTKITKSRLYEGKDGAKYLNAVLIETPQGKYGDFMIVEDITKEERESGMRGVILGNGKNVQKRSKNAPQANVERNQPIPDEENIPF